MKALTLFRKREVSVVPEREITPAVVKDYLRTFGIGSKLTDDEMDRYVMMAVDQQLNPLKRELHVAVFVDPNTGHRNLTLMTGYEVYLRRAEASGLMEWWTCDLENPEDFTKMFSVVTIKRKDREKPFTWKVWYTEASDSKKPIWKARPRFMLEKCCISQAFRLYFPEILGGMPYTKEEMNVRTSDEDGPAGGDAEAITVDFDRLSESQGDEGAAEGDREGDVRRSDGCGDGQNASSESMASFSDLVKLVNKAVPQAERPMVMADGKQYIDDPEGMGRYLEQIKEKYHV